MAFVQLISVGLIYFILQLIGVRFLGGYWSRAAMLAVPLLALMIGWALIGMQLGVVGAELALLLALPVGILYLCGVIGLRFVALVAGHLGRMFASEQNIDARQPNG